MSGVNGPTVLAYLPAVAEGLVLALSDVMTLFAQRLHRPKEELGCVATMWLDVVDHCSRGNPIALQTERTQGFLL